MDIFLCKMTHEEKYQQVWQSIPDLNALDCITRLRSGTSIYLTALSSGQPVQSEIKFFSFL
jgi:hypothetical protein